VELGIRGKVALVAAASKGLGRAAAWELAREGAKVAIAARGEGLLRQVAAEMAEDTGSPVIGIPADVSVAEEVEALFQAAQEAYGRVDILVNNAGGPRPGVFTDMSDEDWLRAVELNLLSTIRLTRLALPGMRERRWGRIINITSMSVKQPIPNLILSNAVRAGVVGMAKTLADQVAAEGIAVNNVCPGYMLTDRVKQLSQTQAEAEGVSVDEVLQRSLGDIPAGRIGQPEELAALIAFLASERAAYITGATIQVDGGRYRGLM
jgi:3-oxoacyl-[acyl-carrier protein] reductase